MAARKPLFMSAEGWSEEMAVSDSMTLGGLTMGGNIDMGVSLTNKIVNLATPTGDNDAANKAYVDAVAQSLVIKDPVLAIETLANITLSGLAQTIDGVAIDTDGMRVLLNAQTDAKENGIWVAHSGAWTRPLDFAAGAHASGAFCFVEEGSEVGESYADTGWVCTTDGPTDVIGTNNLTFVQFSAAGQITASTGLVKVGQDIRVKPGDGIEVTSNSASTNVALSASNPGLALVGTAGSKTLEAAVVAAGGIEKAATGLQLKLNGTTLQTSGSGVSVKGLPPLFEINADAVSANVTADNLDTLTGGGNADALHVHSPVASPSAQRVENSTPVSEAVAAGDPVYWSSTNDQVAKGDTVDSKAKIVGVARTAQGTPGSNAPIVSLGACASVLSGATVGTPYYLATGGGVSASLPGAGKRVIRVGYAKNATDLWVEIQDLGKKAA